MPKRHASILGTVGRTPVVRINKLAPSHVNLYVKIESFNPMGSVKDRLALGIIEDAERSGRLEPHQTVIEASSGNTGIGLAMVCAQKGYPLVVVMGENFSIERRKLMRFLGARVVLTPATYRSQGLLGKAIELAKAHGWFLCHQFENEANADMHSRTTAREILEDFSDQRLDYWVTGCGTGGTLKGVARVLREESPHTKIVVCEPDNSQVLGSGVPQPRDANGAPLGSHPLSRPHPIQGVAPDFIPKLTEDAMRAGFVDRIMPVNGDDAMRLSHELARREGIFVGISSGAAFAAALEVCQTAPAGSTILCMLPDTGERYQTTPLFADIAADMTEEELEISRSTPGYRFDTPVCALPSRAAAPPQPVTPRAVEFVQQALAAGREPVVMFALEWCEFCWAARKLFARHQIPYRSIDLDSVPYQKDNWGGEIRAALTAHTSCTTIPQVFVAGEFVGGATDALTAWKEGRLQQILARAGVSYDASQNLDPYSFLPAWLHPR
jgi:cysteine synthase A